jgi:hypothetical protein
MLPKLRHQAIKLRNMIYLNTSIFIGGRNGSVGTGNRYGLEGPQTEFR